MRRKDAQNYQNIKERQGFIFGSSVAKTERTLKTDLGDFWKMPNTILNYFQKRPNGSTSSGASASPVTPSANSKKRVLAETSPAPAVEADGDQAKPNKKPKLEPEVNKRSTIEKALEENSENLSPERIGKVKQKERKLVKEKEDESQEGKVKL